MTRANLKICTVFRNENMYHNFFTLNTCILRYSLEGIDNREKNQGLPELYNQTIEKYLHDDTWLFFVHEDFEIKESLDHIFYLDPFAVYGTFGVRMEGNVPVGIGRHVCSNKDGSNAVEVGLEAKCPTGFINVQSLDCQSILLHSSFLSAYPTLRFDECLSFDLYAEDLCLLAGCKLGLSIRVFPLNFQHYSHGKITERYHAGLKYLEHKYPEHGIPGSCSFIGGLATELSKKFKYDVRATVSGRDP